MTDEEFAVRLVREADALREQGRIRLNRLGIEEAVILHGVMFEIRKARGLVLTDETERIALIRGLEKRLTDLDARSLDETGLMPLLELARHLTDEDYVAKAALARLPVRLAGSRPPRLA